MFNFCYTADDHTFSAALLKYRAGKRKRKVGLREYERSQTLARKLNWVLQNTKPSCWRLSFCLTLFLLSKFSVRVFQWRSQRRHARWVSPNLTRQPAFTNLEAYYRVHSSPLHFPRGLIQSLILPTEYLYYFPSGYAYKSEMVFSLQDIFDKP